MKLYKTISTIIIALSFGLFFSCAKEETYSEYDMSVWSGNYPTKVENNDTGQSEDATVHIILEFSHGGLEGTITRSINGLLSANKIKYEVMWYSKDNFTLCETNAGQTIRYYSGTIKGDKMIFEFLSCDKVERTIELSRE